MKRLLVWFVDVAAWSVGSAIDKAWDYFDFDDRDD